MKILLWQNKKVRHLTETHRKSSSRQLLSHKLNISFHKERNKRTTFYQGSFLVKTKNIQFVWRENYSIVRLICQRGEKCFSKGCIVRSEGVVLKWEDLGLLVGWCDEMASIKAVGATIGRPFLGAKSFLRTRNARPYVEWCEHTDNPPIFRRRTRS